MTARSIPDFPSISYAIKKQKPDLKREVQRTLSNCYGRNTLYNSITENCVPYYIKLHRVYYQGDWKRGLPNGVGLAIYNDGSYFQGKFVDGNLQDSEGFLILPNGAYYKGNIEKSVINGQGEMRHEDYSYRGSWVNGKPHGNGYEKYGQGKFYKGEFRNGLKHGKGIYVDEQLKQQYQGEFRDGFMNGHGSYRVDGNLVYQGEFQRGSKVGKGYLITEKGRLYGEFKDDVVNGLGTFEWNDGRVYKGEFVNSRFHGEGEIVLKNGNVLRGSWKDGHSEKLTLVPQKQ